MITKSDIAASVRQRLLNLSRVTGQDFQRVLVRYGIERLLYRLSRSRERDRFVLKGAMLFAAWEEAPFRATGDLDLLGYGADDVDRALQAFRRICAAEAGASDDDHDHPRADGLIFDAASIKVERTRQGEDYQGLHVRLEAMLKSTRIPLLIDIGFGDVVTPSPIDLDYPCLLEGAAPAKIRAYPPETVIAEKFDAMILFDAATTRLKDHYDIWAISRTFSFDLETLVTALRATLARRGRALPEDWPASLQPRFAAQRDKQTQWKAFLRRTAPTLAPPGFPELVEELRAFLAPVMSAMRAGEVTTLLWRPGIGWKPPEKV